MQDLIDKFKVEVLEKSKNESFIHHKWFIKHHLDIVEKISLELCGIYNNADKNILLVLVWLHDYGKILDFDRADELVLTKGKEKLLEIGFDDAFVSKVIEYTELIDKSTEIDLNNSPIEVKIVSSADAASHFIGPFFALHWYENPGLSVEELLERNTKKVSKDWERKMVLSEVRKVFKDRIDFVLEQSGQFPDKFLND